MLPHLVSSKVVPVSLTKLDTSCLKGHPLPPTPMQVVRFSDWERGTMTTMQLLCQVLKPRPLSYMQDVNH